jgi:N-acetylmuramoyl-L-alanine amidase
LGAPLAEFPRRTRKRRVYIDAGHGAPGNSGGNSAFCEAEEGFTLAVAEDLARRLETTQKLEVRLSRQGDARPPYPSRLREAQAWGADVFLSIHEDMRGWATYWEPDPGRRCLREDVSPGFAVLWSDSGDAGAISLRHGLARRLSERMQQAGFLPYDGWHYQGLYDADADEAGVFVDRHAPGGRIYVLRRPAMPSVIIETHNGLDVQEAARWKEERTLEAFGASVAAALADFFSAPAR